MGKLGLFLLLCMSGLAHAEAPAAALLTSNAATQDSTGSSTAPADVKSSNRRYYNGDMLFGERVGSVHENPIASFTAGYIYTFTDSQTGHNRSIMGWSAMPTVRLAKYLELQADFSGTYVRSIYPGENKFLAAAGPRYTFAPRSRFTPFVYAEGGEIRTTQKLTQGSDWNTVVKGGIGFEHKMSRGIALQLIPGEYMGTQLDNHLWENSYSARAGLTFNLYR